jgi:hypothetical protein
VPRPQIEDILLEAGWSTRQVSDARAGFADVPFTIPLTSRFILKSLTAAGIAAGISPITPAICGLSHRVPVRSMSAGQQPAAADEAGRSPQHDAPLAVEQQDVVQQRKE